MKAARLSWFEHQLDLDPDRLVFLDETATNTKMVRRYGRAPRGKRCRGAVPFGHWKTITVTAGLRTSGLTATALFDGPMTGARFRGYVEECVSGCNFGSSALSVFLGYRLPKLCRSRFMRHAGRAGAADRTWLGRTCYA